MATIREVASHAGVSIGTVSKVLNGRDDRVDPATRERILESIRALRYRPPAFEMNQKAAIAHNIGMIVPDLTERPLHRQGYVHLLLDGVLERAAMRGYSVTIFAETMWDDVGNAVRRKYDGKCDGLVVVAPQPSRDIVDSLHKRGAPVVQVGTTAWLSDVSSVDIDNFEAGRLVARHFLDLGHVRLGFLSHYHNQLSAQERYEGFCREAGPDVTNFCLQRGESMEDLIRRILDLGDERPTALMAWHDGMAIASVLAFREAGIDIPGDVSIAGVDDSYEAVEKGISLTTVDNPLHDLGALAADMTIDRVIDPTLQSKIVRKPPALIVRATTGPRKNLPQNSA